MLSFFSVHFEMAEYQPEPFAKLSHLNKPQTNRKINSRSAQDDQKSQTPHPFIDRFDHFQHYFSLFSHFIMLSSAAF